MSETSFQYAGATVELIDAATVLAAARVNPVELLRKAEFPAPVRRVELSVSSAEVAGGPVHVFSAEISAAEYEMQIATVAVPPALSTATPRSIVLSPTRTCSPIWALLTPC